MEIAAPDRVLRLLVDRGAEMRKTGCAMTNNRFTKADVARFLSEAKADGWKIDSTVDSCGALHSCVRHEPAFLGGWVQVVIAERKPLGASRKRRTSVGVKSYWFPRGGSETVKEGRWDAFWYLGELRKTWARWPDAK